jgi:uncharacterized damage-inducible protein DinB
MSRTSHAPVETTELLLALIDEGYERKAWHGPNLRGSLRGVDLDVASFRPGPERHNIWEIMLHAAYWKYIVRRRLLGEKKGSFPLAGSNWFERPEEKSAAAWRRDLRLLDETHRSLRAAVSAFPAKRLDQKTPGSKVTNLSMLTGIAAHDVYHAGQIQLLKRLARWPPARIGGGSTGSSV